MNNCPNKLVECEESRHTCEKDLFVSRQIIKDIGPFFYSTRYDSLFTNLLALQQYPALQSRVKEILVRIALKSRLPSYGHPAIYYEEGSSMLAGPCEQALAACREKNNVCKKATQELFDNVRRYPKYDILMELYSIGYGPLLEYLNSKMENPKVHAYMAKVDRIVTNYLLDRDTTVMEGIYEEII
jgi:hypothetical protein